MLAWFKFVGVQAFKDVAGAKVQWWSNQTYNFSGLFAPPPEDSPEGALTDQLEDVVLVHGRAWEESVVLKQKKNLILI